VVAKYDVRVVLPDEGKEEVYTIHALTKEKRAAVQEITIVKAESESCTFST
jgi:hypothetical protein